MKQNFSKKIKFRFWNGMTLKYVTDESLGTAIWLSKNTKEGYTYIAQQYIGISDINNKDIYEGDIVKDLTSYIDLYETSGLFENNRVICNLEVYYCLGECQYRMKNDFYEYHDKLTERRLEVIGNIYENPELLKVKNELKE